VVYSVSKVGIDLIKKHEGFRAAAYRCPAGVWTIGYGHTKDVEPGDLVDSFTADKFLEEDLEPIEAMLTKELPGLSQPCVDALASFVFNVGPGAFLGSTLLQHLKQLKPLDKIKEEWLKWDKADGKVLPGLTKRREEEVNLFTSAYVTKGTLTQTYKIVFPAEDFRSAVVVNKDAFDLVARMVKEAKLRHTVRDMKLYVDLKGDAPPKVPAAIQKPPGEQKKGFDFHLVCNLRQRKAKLFNSAGKLLYSCPCRGEGQEGTFKWEGHPTWTGWAQDTPPGVWDVGPVEWITTRSSADKPYGRVFVWLTPVSGEAARVNRPGIGLHGGGSGLANPFADEQGWMITHGCVRFQNKHLEDLLSKCKINGKWGKIQLTTSW